MPRARLPLFLAVVFAVKLVVVWQLHSHPLLQPDAGIDTTAYVQLADRVRAGDLLLGPGLYFVSPLYIYWLAATLTATGSFTAVRVLQAGLGTAAVALMFVAADRWFGERAAWLAAGAAALTGLFTFYESLLLQTALDPFLTAAALAALSCGLTGGSAATAAKGRGLKRERTTRPIASAAGRAGRWLFAAGAIFGVQSFNRPNVLVAAAAIIVVLAATRRQRMAALIAAGVAIALVPGAIRNAAVADTWLPLASHGGLNFFIGNNADADGTYHSVNGITPSIAGQAVDTRRVAEAALGRPLSDAEVSRYFVRLGLTWIRQHNRAAAALLLKKLGLTFGAAHVPLNDSYPFYAYDAATILPALFVGAWLLVPLGVAGLVFCAPTRQRPEYLVWASFVPAYAVGVAIFFAADRYRLPLLVPLCVGTGALVHALAAQGVRRQGLAVVAALLLFVAVTWPVHIDDGRSEERTRMAEERATAGDVSAAERWSQQAKAIGADPVVVDLRVGRTLARNHDPGDAVRFLARASAAAPNRGEIDYALGEALLDAGRATEAIPHLRAAVRRSVRPDVAGIDLVKALTATGELAAAREALNDVTPADPNDAPSWLALGETAVQLNAPDLELRFFARAVAVDAGNPVAHLNLAVALAQAGRLDDARREATIALRLRPDYDKAKQLLDAIK